MQIKTAKKKEINNTKTIHEVFVQKFNPIWFKNDVDNLP